MREGDSKGAANMSKVQEAFGAGRKAVVQRTAQIGMLGDPAGQEHERERLRNMGKWRFIFLRGIIGFSGPLFVWLVLTHLSEDVHSAREFHQDALSYLLRSWMGGLFISAFLGCVVGLSRGGDLLRKYGRAPSLIPNPRSPRWVRSANDD